MKLLFLIMGFFVICGMVACAVFFAVGQKSERAQISSWRFLQAGQNENANTFKTKIRGEQTILIFVCKKEPSAPSFNVRHPIPSFDERAVLKIDFFDEFNEIVQEARLMNDEVDRQGNCQLRQFKMSKKSDKLCDSAIKSAASQNMEINKRNTLCFLFEPTVYLCRDDVYTLKIRDFSKRNGLSIFLAISE